jgi:hypothetical protein
MLIAAIDAAPKSFTFIVVFLRPLTRQSREQFPKPEAFGAPHERQVFNIC